MDDKVVDKVLEASLGSAWLANSETEHLGKLQDLKAEAKAKLLTALDGAIGEDEKGEQVQTGCPDDIDGCAVMHYEYRMTPEGRTRNALRAEIRQNIYQLFGKEE